MSGEDKSGKRKTFLQVVGEQLAAQVRRARERLKTYRRGEWNFAIVGLDCDCDSISHEEEVVTFRKVVEPPDGVLLSSALESPDTLRTIVPYSNQFRHEVAVSQDVSDDFEVIQTVALCFITGLRVKTLAEILVPAAVDCSWSVIAGIDDHTCKAKLLEDVPHAKRLAEPVKVVEEDLRWAFEKILIMRELLENPRFRLAVEALLTHPYQFSPRMMAASIWSGIEALMDFGQELRFRLALSVASLIEPRGEQRYERYRQTIKLYDVRSKAVHGAELDDAEIRQHVMETRKLLSYLICHMLDTGKVLSREEMERMVLG